MVIWKFILVVSLLIGVYKLSEKIEANDNSK